MARRLRIYACPSTTCSPWHGLEESSGHSTIYGKAIGEFARTLEALGSVYQTLMGWTLRIHDSHILILDLLPFAKSKV